MQITGLKIIMSMRGEAAPLRAIGFPLHGHCSMVAVPCQALTGIANCVSALPRPNGLLKRAFELAGTDTLALGPAKPGIR